MGEWRGMLREDPTWALFSHVDAFSRFLILTSVEGLPPDHQVPRSLWNSLATSILGAQGPDGSWSRSVYLDASAGTLKQLIRLGQLGYTEGHPAVARAVDYIAAHQLGSGGIGEEPSARTPDMCRHHFTGNLCVSLDSLRALTAVRCVRRSLLRSLVNWILHWQREDGSWWSPAASHREMRGILGQPGCGLWLTCWALLALAGLNEEPERDARRRAVAHLLGQYGASGAPAWTQSPDEFMWCAVGERIPAQFMEGLVTGSVLQALSVSGCGLNVPEVAAAVERLVQLQGQDGFWRMGHQRLDGWLTLTILLALARLHGDVPIHAVIP